jgi:hypothetical protein
MKGGWILKPFLCGTESASFGAVKGRCWSVRLCGVLRGREETMMLFFPFLFFFFLIDQDKDMVKPQVSPRTITQILTEY